ncbi:hypothetical protein [Streptosporangium oxazolinicum]
MLAELSERFSTAGTNHVAVMILMRSAARISPNRTISTGHDVEVDAGVL